MTHHFITLKTRSMVKPINHQTAINPCRDQHISLRPQPPSQQTPHHFLPRLSIFLTPRLMLPSCSCPLLITQLPIKAIICQSAWAATYKIAAGDKSLQHGCEGHRYTATSNAIISGPCCRLTPHEVEKAAEAPLIVATPHPITAHQSDTPPICISPT